MPYVRRDGIPVPATVLHSPDSGKYDRTRLQLVFDHTAILSLAFYFTEEPAYAEHAAELFRTWFLRRETRMKPHLEYAQVRRGHRGDRNPARGIIETKDFHVAVDSIRILRRSEAWTREDDDRMASWCETFFTWLRASPQGREENRATHNHGTYYDLQVAALGGFLGHLDVCLEVLNRSQMRIPHQFAPDGSQPHELARSRALHYCAFNLQGWAHLARLAECFGVDLWTYEEEPGRTLRRSFEWLLAHRERAWPYAQRDPFDRGRLEPLLRVGAARYPGLAPAGAPDRPVEKLRFHPHDGIRPYWILGL
jgi:hypothetical protein